MGILVQKFGGTSVGTIERIQHVADIVIEAKQAGHDVVVVVSAMSGETDRLIQLAKQIQAEPTPREYAALVATGEQVSVALLSMALIEKGYTARSYTGMQAKILTDESHMKARIQSIDTEDLLGDLAESVIPVVAGFQGYDLSGDITTLGRGGSDTSAVALAAALDADECQIYTDVDGVYSADPRIVPDARRMDRVTFEEMLELASLGAKVLQIRAVQFAGKYNVPLRVLSSFEKGPGTLISYEEKDMEKPVVSGVAYTRNEAKLTIFGVPDKPGVAYQILGPISKEGIEIDMIIQNIAQDGLIDFTFTVSRDDYPKALRLLRETAVSLHARDVAGEANIAKLSLVGVGMRSHAGIASTMFHVLAQNNINIQMISTSEIKVSVIIAEEYLELGVRVLHSAFHLGEEKSIAEEYDPNLNKLAHTKIQLIDSK